MNDLLSFTPERRTVTDIIGESDRLAVLFVNVIKLKAIIAERGTTLEAIADSAGMSRSTLYRKLKGNGSKLTIGEIHKIVQAVPLSKEEAIEIFFNCMVA